MKHWCLGGVKNISRVIFLSSIVFQRGFTPPEGVARSNTGPDPIMGTFTPTIRPDLRIDSHSFHLTEQCRRILGAFVV